MRVSFNWLKDYVDLQISAEEAAEKLTMAGLEVTSLTKVDHDVVFEIEVTPNRADCLSIIGIAREIAAVTGTKLKMPQSPSLRGVVSADIPIQIRDKELCRRYLGRVIRNVQVRPSPDWLVHRLEVMGIHPVNNIVDITNFCLLEFGQPLHAFDLDKLQGPRIIVRRASEGEKITTIDAVTRELHPETLVIADKSSPQAIAGIMGSKDSEVDENTVNILLESAAFEPLNIHNTSQKLALATQSSYRFERGIDEQVVEAASLRATELIKELAGTRKTKIGRLTAKGAKPGQAAKVSLRYSQVSRLLGVEVAPAQIQDILQRLEFPVRSKSKQELIVQIPSFRNDISREADLIEEIARLYEYDKIPLRVSELVPDLSSAGALELASEQAYHLIRRLLANLGLNEIMSYSLISRQSLRRLEIPYENIIAVKNPLSYEQEILRPTLLAGMFRALLNNINRKNLNLRLFELSRIYYRESKDTTGEATNLCMAITGRESDNWMQKGRAYSFFDLKGIVQALLDKLGIGEIRFIERQYPLFVAGRSAQLQFSGGEFGFLGEVKRQILDRFDIPGAVYMCELRIEKLLAHICYANKFRPLPRFPSIERDISLIIPREIRSEEIIALIKKNGRDIIAKVTLFDQYFGEQIPPGLRGLAYSIEYYNKDRTLTAEEVDKVHTRIRQALTGELKAQMR